MNSDAISKGLSDIDETLLAVIDGLKQLGGQQGHIADICTEILKVLTAEPEGKSPVLELLEQLVGWSERHSRALDRIEDRLTRLEKARP